MHALLNIYQQRAKRKIKGLVSDLTDGQSRGKETKNRSSHTALAHHRSPEEVGADPVGPAIVFAKENGHFVRENLKDVCVVPHVEKKEKKKVVQLVSKQNV